MILDIGWHSKTLVLYSLIVGKNSPAFNGHELGHYSIWKKTRDLVLHLLCAIEPQFDSEIVASNKLMMK